MTTEYYFECAFDWSQVHTSKDGDLVAAIACVARDTTSEAETIVSFAQITTDGTVSKPIHVRVYDNTRNSEPGPSITNFMLTYAPVEQVGPITQQPIDLTKFPELRPSPAFGFGSNLPCWGQGSPFTLPQGRWQVTVTFWVTANGTSKKYRHDPEVIVGNPS